MPDYRFISLEYDARIPSGLTNTFVVRGDNWNDFTNHVRFDLIYFDGEGERTKFGKLKALHRMPYGASSIVESKTALPDSFFQLDESYISLGQSADYYVALGNLFGTLEAVEILRALRDIAELPGIVADFETSAPFRNGMMRDNAAKRARRFGRAWVRGDPVSIEPAFTYACRLGGSPLPITAEFDFAAKATLPSRIVGDHRQECGRKDSLSVEACCRSRPVRAAFRRAAVRQARPFSGRFAVVLARDCDLIQRF